MVQWLRAGRRRPPSPIFWRKMFILWRLDLSMVRKILISLGHLAKDSKQKAFLSGNGQSPAHLRGFVGLQFYCKDLEKLVCHG